MNNRLHHLFRLSRVVVVASLCWLVGTPLLGQTTATTTPANCAPDGTLTYNFVGTAPFTVSYEGMTLMGTQTTSSSTLTLTALSQGPYTSVVTDADGNETQLVTVVEGSAGLSVATEATAANCAADGTIRLSYTGAPPFTASYEGATLLGTQTTGDNSLLLSGLPAGDYAFVVTDNGGCEETFTVNVPGSNGVTATATTTPANCAPDGTLTLTYTGTPPFTAFYEGRTLMGNQTSMGNTLVLTGLPHSRYDIRVVDGDGCTTELSATVGGSAGLDLGVTTTGANCMLDGEVALTLSGAPPFTISYEGPTILGTQTTTDETFSLRNQPPGDYTIRVTDAGGCTSEQTVTVGGSLGIEIGGVATPAICGPNGQIRVEVSGAGPYTYMYTGPVSGMFDSPEFWVDIKDLLPGLYTIRVTGSDGCIASTQVLVTDAGLEIGALATPAICGGTGNIRVEAAGPGPYTYEYSGPVSGMFDSPEFWVDIDDLPPGTYTIKVTASNGCMATVEVVVPENGLELGGAPTDAMCGNGGSIRLEVGAVGPFTYMYTGPVSGMFDSPEFWVDINDLPPGTYTIKVTAASGCTGMITVEVGEKPCTPGADAALIRGRVWDDMNRNGIQEEEEEGREDFQVIVEDPGSGFKAMLMTDDDGRYSTNVPAGTYKLIFGVGDSMLVSSPTDVGNDDTIDSDMDSATMMITQIVVALGDTVVLDAGFRLRDFSISEDDANSQAINLIGLGIYPNPVAADFATLRFSQETTEPGTLVLMDLSGRVLSRTVLPAGTWQHPISTAGLPRGMYVVSWQTAKGAPEIIRMQKQ